MTRVITAVALFVLSLPVVMGVGHFGDFLAEQSPSEQPQLKLMLGDEKETYKFGDDVRFKVIVENQSAEQARVAIIDPYYQNRPKLLRNGTVVDYQAKADRLVRSKDKSTDVIRLTFVSIGPYSSKSLPWLDLKEWYGVLPPGSYRLTNRYRISFEGPWTKDSVEIQFSVVKEH